MYLLDTRTARLHHFLRSRDLRYAILSHVWQDVRNELSFRDVQAIGAECALSGENPRDRMSPKIRNCCIFAERAGYAWVWIDTCCIDHNSSAELSEAINSMFAWYADADVCYAYLYDVGDHEDPSSRDSAFRRSRWYERGWTLQELIAPVRVVFLSQTWRTLGSKHTLASVVEEVTAVQKEILTHERSLDSISVAQRMSWASKRQTTRIEDRAYSLLGIFRINMPTIYGEGLRAFARLQEEILRQIPDQSIFAWGPLHADLKVARHLMENDKIDDSARHRHNSQRDVALGTQARLQDMLAPSPSDFVKSAGYKSVSLGNLATTFGLEEKIPHYALTSHGIHVTLPISAGAVDSWKSWIARTGTATTQHVRLALLACENAKGDLVILFLRRANQAIGPRYAVGEFVDGTEDQHYYRGAFFNASRLLYEDAVLSEHEEAQEPFMEGHIRGTKKQSFRYGKFVLNELYVHHQGPGQDVRELHPDGPIHEVMAPVPHFTFILPHWLHTQLESRYGLVCTQRGSDGAVLKVPCQLTADQVQDGVFADATFVDAARKERLVVRIGLGNCFCLMVPYPGVHGAPLHKLWVQMRVAQSTAEGDEWEALPKLSGPEQAPACSRSHINFTMVRGDHAMIRCTFGDDRRHVEVSFRKCEGFELIRRIPCKTYTVTLDVSGPAYAAAPGPGSEPRLVSPAHGHSPQRAHSRVHIVRSRSPSPTGSDHAEDPREGAATASRLDKKHALPLHASTSPRVRAGNHQSGVIRLRMDSPRSPLSPMPSPTSPILASRGGSGGYT
ncbi:HET-domain-containing protein [Pilatotrama ljubarskyi]|nr:HET-domain-containing protein [Pilatotrama ljubarskyi]